MTDIKNGIESLEFKNVSELAETMIEDDTKCYRTAVLPFYNAIWLVRELMLYEDVGVDYLDWYMPEYNDYDGHYYVTLDDDNYLSIEPCYKNGKFIMCGGDIMYIDGDAEAEILRKNADQFEEMYEICFTDEYNGSEDDFINDLEDDNAEDSCECAQCSYDECKDVELEFCIDSKDVANLIRSVLRDLFEF